MYGVSAVINSSATDHVPEGIGTELEAFSCREKRGVAAVYETTIKDVEGILKCKGLTQKGVCIYHQLWGIRTLHRQ